MEERRPANIHQRCRGHRQPVNRKTAGQGTTHVLDKTRRAFASPGPMCRAQRRVARALSTMVPGYRITPDRPSSELGTPPFLTVPVDSRAENRRAANTTRRGFTSLSSIWPACEAAEHKEPAWNQCARDSDHVFERGGEKAALFLPDCLGDEEIIHLRGDYTRR
jgi:hypothetical protein